MLAAELMKWNILLYPKLIVLAAVVLEYISADAPEIQKFSFQDDIFEGKRVSVTCLVASNSKAVNFNWYKNGKEISSSERNLKIRNDNEFSVLILDPVNLQDNANYTCKATNIHGSVQHTAYLNVKAPPKWLETPKDIITTIGDSATVTCDASGSPKPKIYWKKLSDKMNTTILSSSKEQVSNESSNQLKLSSITYDTAGLVVTWIFMQAKASEELPEIEKFHFKENVKEGDFVSVVCLVKTGAQPITFLWYKNGNELIISNKKMSIENSPVISALILNSVTTENDGNYTCVAKNNFGSDRHSAVLKIKASPKWISQPNNIITVIGDAITASCMASGSPTPQIMWRKIAEPRTQSLYNLNSTYLNNSDSTIKISRVSYGDSGTYECTADNGIQPSIKANFTVIIREPPIIKKFQFEENVKEGDFVSVVCIVKSGTQPITFMWFKDGQEFRSSSKDASIENSPVTSALILNSVTSESDGNYTCKAKNSYGSDQHSSALKVKASPKWILQPSDVVTVMGEAISIQCIASGSPVPQVIWKKYSDIPEIQKFTFQDNIIQGKLVSAMCLALSEAKPLQFQWVKDGKILKSDSQNIRIEDSDEYSILILNKVTLDNEGNYTCSATNIHGSSKHSAYLTIRAPPLWIKTPEDVTKAIGESVTFTCSASGSPKPSISWKKYLGDENKWIVINSNEDYITEDKESSLKIKSLSYEDSGLYKCIASNAVKPNISANFTLTIRVKIEPFNFSRRFSIGEKAQATCLVVSESDDIQFQWFKDRLPLKESDNVRLKSSNDFSIIIIDSVELSSRGNYTCKVTDGKDSAEYSALSVAGCRGAVRPSAAA
ncbi:titin, partial [Trichonephila clavipes]